MDVETVVAVPVVSAIVGVLVWYLQSRIEAVRAERRRLQDERRKIYIAILEPYIFAFLQGSRSRPRHLRQ